jgi:hypothetical protein
MNIFECHLNNSFLLHYNSAIKPIAVNSEFGTVPVTFHMELRKGIILADADMQSTICYSIIVLWDSHKANEIGEK